MAKQMTREWYEIHRILPQLFAANTRSPTVNITLAQTISAIVVRNHPEYFDAADVEKCVPGYNDKTSNGKFPNKARSVRQIGQG